MRRWPDADAIFRLTLLALWTVPLFGGLPRWTLVVPPTQGRLMFPAISSVACFFALGWEGWLPHRRRRRSILLGLAEAAMAGMATWVPLGVIRPA